MMYVNRHFTFVVILMSTILLAGCAISGSGNPVSTNIADSNNDIGYVHEEKNVTVNYPERGPIQPKQGVRKAKITGKFAQYL